MATHDYSVANDTGANVRADINNALSAIVSNNSSATEPSTTYAYQWWADTANDLLKQRNSANNAWISILTLSTGAPSAGTGISNVVEDTTPQLGGNLDLNSNNITGTGDIPAGNLTGSLPAISGASLTNLPASGVTAKTVHATYDLSTASGTQDITGFGFQPSMVHCIMFVNITDDWCFGFTDFTMHRGIHTTGTTTAVLQGTAAFAIFQTTTGGGSSSARQTANPVTAISDGIRITWTKLNSPTGTGQIYLIGIK